MITMTQNEYESITDEGLDELESEMPKGDVELKKMRIETSQEAKR